MARLTEHTIPVEFTPLTVSGGLTITGGPAVQFYDGENYLPNRAGSPASPIIIEHEVDIIDIDEMVHAFSKSTTFYENDTAITINSEDYEIIPPNAIRVEKNIPPGEAVTIRAITEFLDPRSNRYYSREDTLDLRTILKADHLYQLELDPRDRQVFDAYRNPNRVTAINLKLLKGEDEITDFAGLTIKWLNGDGQPAVANELYAVETQNSNKRLVVDTSFIENETIRCEIWEGSKVIASDSVNFTRRYNSFRTDIEIPELPIVPGTRQLTADIYLDDLQGNIDADGAFDIRWLLNTAGSEEEVAAGSSADIPIARLDLTKALSIYPDVKRRQAFGALKDNNNKILTNGAGIPLAFQLLGK